mmetsp:Transcript_8570/g.17285  ORF Transcript_8570/g.17285 Transcript_8570/m.17285 type:complete len:752 (-) Transcript_8570:250-2505(-)
MSILMMRRALWASSKRSPIILAGRARKVALSSQSPSQSCRRTIIRSSNTHHMISKLHYFSTYRSSRPHSVDYSSRLIQRRSCYARYFSNLSNSDDNNRKPFSPAMSAAEANKRDEEFHKQTICTNNTNSLSNAAPLNVDLEPPNVSRILSILKPEVSSLLLALGALTVSTAATLQSPNAIGEMIDILSTAGVAIDSTIIDSSLSSEMSDMPNSNITAPDNINVSSDTTTQLEQQKLDQIQSIALQMLGFFTVGSAATFYHSTSFETIGQKIGARLRKQLFSTIIHQNITFFDQNRGGELANRLSTDVHEVAEHLVQNISIFMSNMVRSITAVASMMAISPALTLYLTPLPLALGGCAAVYGKFIKIWSKKHLDVLAHSTHMATERFGGITTVLSFGRRQSEVTNYSNVVESAYVFARKVAIFQGAFLGSSYLVGNTALMGTLVVGATFVIDGSMTAGQLAGFCMFAGHLAESVLEISESVGGFLRAQGSGARLFFLLDKDSSELRGAGGAIDTIDGGETLPASYKADVQFDGVDFYYPSHTQQSLVLDNLSFKLSDGEMLAVSGSSGSGKSSIVALLMRFYSPSRGVITLGGKDIYDLNVEWLRSQISIVGQEPILFHATIFENVSYGRPDATREEVIKACVAANAHSFIMGLSENYNTIVGERGKSISGGQKQRLCIARALLTEPRILALDESSSALDAQAEQELLLSLRRLLESDDNNLSAVLFVTHKNSVMNACDRSIMLSEGKTKGD